MKTGNPSDNDHQRLYNPLSAEFGVTTAKEMEHLVKEIADFTLVRTAFRLELLFCSIDCRKSPERC